MLNEEVKAQRRRRNVYCVDEVYKPATEQQKWTLFQLCALDEIATRPDFDYWVAVSITPKEYEENWHSCPKTMLYYDKSGRLHLVVLGRRRILRERTAEEGR